MNYRPATEADAGQIVRFRLSSDEHKWYEGRLEVRNGDPLVVPGWGSVRLPSWANVEIKC